MDIPPRTATDRHLSLTGERLDIVFDADLGELIEGHHVVARGIMLGRPVRVPAFDPDWAQTQAAGTGDPGSGGGFVLPGGALRPGAGEPALTEPVLVYEFVPGLTQARTSRQGGFTWYWMLSAADDVGTEYSENILGAFDGSSGGAATRGARNIGGQIPPHARRLTIRFEPSVGWTPPDPWRRQIVVDLHEKRLLD